MYLLIDACLKEIPWNCNGTEQNIRHFSNSLDVMHLL